MLTSIKYSAYIAVVSFLFSAAACKNNKSVASAERPAGDSLSVVTADTVLSVNYDNPAAKEKILLRFNPEIGKTYFITNNSNYNALQARDSDKINSTSKEYAKISLKVLGKTNDVFKMEFTLTDSHKTATNDSASIEYQYGKALADPEADTERMIEDCMVNTPMTIYLTSRGESAGVDGYDAIIDKVKKIVGTEIPDQYLAQEVGTPTDNIENYFIVYPDTAIRIGDTWNYVINTNFSGVPIVLTNLYTLADRKDGKAIININSRVQIDTGKLAPEMAAQMTSLKFNAYIKGTGEIDEKTGWPTIMRLSQGMNMSDAYQGHNMKTSQSNSTVIRLVE